MTVLQTLVYNIFFLIYFLCQVYSESYEKLFIADAYKPGVVKFHETYYMVDTVYKVFSSKDLKVWAREKDLRFDNNGPPKWTNNKEIYCPEIHFINKKYNLYFDNVNKEGHWVAGVATADSPLGPFRDYGRLSIDDVWNPHIVHEGT